MSTWNPSKHGKKRRRMCETIVKDQECTERAKMRKRQRQSACLTLFCADTKYCTHSRSNVRVSGKGNMHLTYCPSRKWCNIDGYSETSALDEMSRRRQPDGVRCSSQGLQNVQEAQLVEALRLQCQNGFLSQRINVASFFTQAVSWDKEGCFIFSTQCYRLLFDSRGTPENAFVLDTWECFAGEGWLLAFPNLHRVSKRNCRAQKSNAIDNLTNVVAFVNRRRIVTWTVAKIDWLNSCFPCGKWERSVNILKNKSRLLFLAGSCQNRAGGRHRILKILLPVASLY